MPIPVATSTATAELASSIAVTRPSGAQLYDTLVVHVSFIGDGAAALATPAGWTYMNDASNTGDPEDEVGSGHYFLFLDADALAIDEHTFECDSGTFLVAGALCTAYRYCLPWDPVYFDDSLTGPFGPAETDLESDAIATIWTGSRVVTVALGNKLGVWTQGELVNDGSSPTAPPPTGGESDGSVSASHIAYELPDWLAGTGIGGGTGSGTKAWPTIVGNPAVDYTEGDYGVLSIQTENETASLSAAQGFAQIADAFGGLGTAGAAGSCAGRLFGCFVTTTYPAAMTSPTVADPGDHWLGNIATFRGVDPDDPINLVVVDTGDGTTVTTSGGETTRDGCLVVTWIFWTQDTATAQVSAWANADLSDVTEHSDAGATTNLGGGIAYASGGKADAGAFGATTATLANSQKWVAITVALNPDPALGTVDAAVQIDAVGEVVEYEYPPSDWSFRRAMKSTVAQNPRAFTFALNPIPGATEADATAPTISNMSPADEAELGPSTAIEFDVVDAAPGIGSVFIFAKQSHQGSTDVVHNGTRFLEPYDMFSERTGDAENGFHFSVRHNNGWLSRPTFDVLPFDSNGNLTGGLPE